MAATCTASLATVSTPGHSARATLLHVLPPELLSVILLHLDTRSLARLAATCRPLWLDTPTPPQPALLPREIGPVEAELRRRAQRDLRIDSSLPKGGLLWVPYLLKCVLRDALRREAPLEAGYKCSLFVDAEGRLHTCGSERGKLLGHAVEPDADPDRPRSIGVPTLVPSMEGRRIVSVAAGHRHCLALSCKGEVYSWGDGTDGSLGHADGGSRAVPSRIESLGRIGSIAAGRLQTSAAVDEVGRLFTWGWASFDAGTRLNSLALGYALDSQTESQLTPKWVEALSADRVVGVALGLGYSLAVTDAGAVFSFGDGEDGLLGHASLETEVLPQRIEALAQTGFRFVAVAAGVEHALTLTEDGELYGWGGDLANGHGRGELTPRQMVAFVGQRVKHVIAGDFSSCAVMETGELYTWGCSTNSHLGHGRHALQGTPKRVKGLSGVKVTAAAICGSHTLVADEDGLVWAFGKRSCLGLGDPDEDVAQGPVLEPARIPTLRVRASKSPDVLRCR